MIHKPLEYFLPRSNSVKNVVQNDDLDGNFVHRQIIL